MKTILSLLLLLLAACSPVKTQVTNQYQLSEFGAKPWGAPPRHLTLMVSPPEAAAGYQTEQMLYIEHPFQVNVFAHNAWLSPPAAMLHPLLVKSLQHTHFFHAVTSNAYSETPDYRLDTHLLNLEQNFLTTPSVIDFSAKVVLTHAKDNRIIASHIFTQHIPCPSDTPLGGVIAANKAVQLFTACVDDFVIAHVK